jgi:hypothetical protein
LNPLSPFHAPVTLVMPEYPHTSLIDNPHVYTHPTITIPPLPFQIYSSSPFYNSPPLYLPNQPTSFKKSPSTARVSTRHHPYLPKTHVLVVRGELRLPKCILLLFWS